MPDQEIFATAPEPEEEHDQILSLELPSAPATGPHGNRQLPERKRQETSGSPELQKLRRQLSTEQRTVSRLSAQQLQYQKERDYVVADLAVRDAYIADLRRRLDDEAGLRSSLAAFGEEVLRLQERVAVLDGERANLQTEVETLRDTLASARAQLQMYHSSRRYRMADRIGGLFGKRKVDIAGEEAV